MNQSKDDLLFWRLFALAQQLPELTPPDLVSWLAGPESNMLDLHALQSLTLATLQARAPESLHALTLNRWQQVMACLQGVLPEHLTVQPERQRPQQLRVAFASQDGVMINGHFGQCRLFFIYAFDSGGAYLLALRRYPGDTQHQEGNEARAHLLSDCHLMFCEAIGGPAAARIIRKNVHPVKVKNDTLIAQQLHALQAMMAERLPPWLAKRLGKESPLENRLFS